MHEHGTPLLPPELDKARAAIPVACPLEIPGRPTCSARHRTRDLANVMNIWSRTQVLAHTGTGPGESWMLVDKQYPHALREVMVMSAGARVRPGLFQHSAAFARSVAAVGAAFAGYCHHNGFYPVLSWSYDPATTDRESIQGEKRFHAHLTARTPADLETVRALTRPLTTYPPQRQRRVVDEATVLAAVLAAGRLPPLEHLGPAAPLSGPHATASLALRIPGGWDALPGALDDLSTVHGVLEGIYADVTSAWTAGQAGIWHRPHLLAQPRWRPFTGAAGDALGHYMRALVPGAAAGVSDATPRRRATHVYPLAGLAYSVVISEDAGQLWAYVRPVVFSDLGGAGVTMINGTVTKVTKGIGVFTAQQMGERAAFQGEFLSWLRRSPHGGAAFCPLMEVPA